jgi:hypothetical protein
VFTLADQRERILVVARGGEGQVEQLQRGLEARRVGGTGDRMRGQRERRASRGNLPRQQLLQIHGLVSPDARQRDERRREHRVEMSIGAGERQAAGRHEVEDHLIVLEVGGLEPGLDAIAEANDGDAEGLDDPAVLDLAGIGRGRHQRRGRARVIPCRHRHALGLRQGLAQLRLGRHRERLLLRRHAENGAARVGEEHRGQGLDLLLGDRRGNARLSCATARRSAR